MDKSFDKLRHTVLQAVEQQRSLALSTTALRRHQSIFAEFVGLQQAELGLLPDEHLTDDVLQRIAHVSECEPNFLRIMLNRSPFHTDSPQDFPYMASDADDAIV